VACRRGLAGRDSRALLRPRVYSKCNAKIASSRAARRAGAKRHPDERCKPHAKTRAQRLIRAGQPGFHPMATAPRHPHKPSPQCQHQGFHQELPSDVASVARRATRKPISRVRSASMMFIMLMPPRLTEGRGFSPQPRVWSGRRPTSRS